jgi:hypothetical protein
MELGPTQAFLKEAHKKLNEVTTARARLDTDYEKKRADIDAQILKWKRAIDVVMAIAESEQGDPSDVEVSGFVEGKPGRQTIKFTDAVRLCLKQQGGKLISVPEVRDGLVNLGFDFGKYAQPLVPIHNCLKRLTEQGEAMTVKNEAGQVIGYKWISPIEQAVAEEYPNYAEANRITEMHEAMIRREKEAAQDAVQMAEVLQRHTEEAEKRHLDAIAVARQEYTKKPKKG